MRLVRENASYKDVRDIFIRHHGGTNDGSDREAVEYWDCETEATVILSLRAESGLEGCGREYGETFLGPPLADKEGAMGRRQSVV